MELAILVILIAIRYGMDRDHVTEIGRFISVIRIPVVFLRRVVNATIRRVIVFVTGVYVLELEGFYVTEMPEGGA